MKAKPGQERAEPVPVHVLPLYAMLPGGAQDAVFRAVPSGHRLIIVATNVAETSLTIPGGQQCLESTVTSSCAFQDQLWSALQTRCIVSSVHHILQG